MHKPSLSLSQALQFVLPHLDTAVHGTTAAKIDGWIFGYINANGESIEGSLRDASTWRSAMYFLWTVDGYDIIMSEGVLFSDGHGRYSNVESFKNGVTESEVRSSLASSNAYCALLDSNTPRPGGDAGNPSTPSDGGVE